MNIIVWYIKYKINKLSNRNAIQKIDSMQRGIPIYDMKPIRNSKSKSKENISIQ